MTLYKFKFCDGLVYDSKTHKSRPTHEFDSVASAVLYVEKRGYANEVLHRDQLTKIFFDFDKVIDKEDWKQVEAENENNIYAIINFLCGRNIQESDIAIAERCRVLPNGQFKISLRYFLPKFVAKYKNIADWLRRSGVSFFDFSVYKETEQLLGAVHNYKKKGDTKALTPMTGHNTEDFIVQIIPKDAITIPLPEKETNTVKVNHDDDEDVDEAHTATIDYDTLREIVMSYKHGRYDNYLDWSQLVWATMNVATGNGYRRKGRDLCHEFSALSNKYKDGGEEATERLIDKARKNGGLSLSSLMYWLKQDNRVAFQKIQNKVNPFCNKVLLNGYSFIDEPTIDLLDGEKRDYETIKDIFEKTNFKVCDNVVKYVELTKLGNEDIEKVRTRNDAKNKCENLFFYTKITKKNRNGQEISVVKESPFFNQWVKDPKMRSYDAMEFLPPPTKADPKVFNLWKGFSASKLDLQITKEDRVELLKPIYAHINIVCKRDVKAFTYIKKWVAQMIQQPSIKIGIALCFQSVEGTGKGTFIGDFLAKGIIGEDYYWESRDCVNDLFSKHSIAFHRKVLVNIDEPSPYDLRNNQDKFKSLITSTKQRIENKGVDAKQVTTCERYMITTNNEDVLKLSSNDRRFVVIECSDELIGNTDYFNYLHQYIKRADVRRAFYDDMVDEDIDGFDWRHERPITEAYMKNMDSCVMPHIRFMAGETKNYDTMAEYNITAKQLFDKFNRTLAWSKSKYTCEYTAFTRMISKLGGVKKRKTMYGLSFLINVDELKDYLQQKEKFDFESYQFYEDVDE